MTPELARLVEALEEIKLGRGAYNRDPLIHCSNTVDEMKRIATDALAAVAQAGAESTRLTGSKVGTRFQQLLAELTLTDARAAIRLAKEMLDEVDDSTLVHLWPERIDNWKALPAVQAALEEKR